MINGVQRYGGCSLEVFEGVDSAELDYAKDTTLSGLVRIAKERGQTHMVRRTLIGTTVIASEISTNGLDHYLAKVDEVFTATADVVGGTVIEHEWGLVARKSVYRGNYYPAHLVGFGISDYLLAAKVPLLKGSTITTLAGEYPTDLFNKLSAAKQAFTKEHGWFAYDTYQPHQFMLVPNCDEKPSLVLHDIDPVTKDVQNDFLSWRT